jgi:beta-lactamase regulating signal transducer with metallopeptidase domain
MTIPLKELHALILYIIFGYTLLLPLLLISMRLFDITGPLQRMHLYLLAFLTPPAAFIVYHTVLVKRCQSGLPPLWSEGAFHFLCIVSEGMLRAFLPMLGLLLLFGMLKAGGAVLIIKRLDRDALTINPTTADRMNTILNDLSATLKIAPPRLIFSKREGFAAFTTGFLKPVLVINHKMPDLLDNREMEALVSHELIHILHRDTLKNWLLHLVRDLTFLNPLSALLLKGYLLEKEMLCDEKAAQLAGQAPKEYATVLLKVWRSILEHRTPRLGIISSFVGSSGMERRVGALLQSKPEKNNLKALITTLLSITLFTSTLLFLGLIC